jgi:hypothetical protein
MQARQNVDHVSVDSIVQREGKPMEKGSAMVGRDFGKRLRKLDDEFDHALYRRDELVSKPLPLLIVPGAGCLDVRSRL